MSDLVAVGPYRIDTPIGTGGFASVYRAWDERLDGMVAVKILADNHSLDDGVRSRFVSEGQLLRRVDSPHVIRVFDVGETERGQPYLVLEYADRGDFESRMAELRSNGYRPDATATEALVTVLGGALAALHSERLVHRDVTPRNLLLRSTSAHADGGAAPAIAGDERLMLADLGFAKDLAASSGLTVAGGTTGFSAPEQRAGGVVDQRADLYAASAIVVWFLTGSAPAPDGRWMRAIREMGYEASLVAALERGLATDPSLRQQTAASWQSELLSSLRIPEDSAEPAPGRLRFLLLAGVAVAVVAILGIVWLVRSGGAEVRDLGGGMVEVSREVAGHAVTLSGPAEVVVGDTARYTTVTDGLASWTWIGPDGRTHPQVPGIDVIAKGPGTATVRLVATTTSGDTVELKHRLVVVAEES